MVGRRARTGADRGSVSRNAVRNASAFEGATAMHRMRSTMAHTWGQFGQPSPRIDLNDVRLSDPRPSWGALGDSNTRPTH
jgi:hypothetical protein